MTSYARLRSIGVSVETADALAPIIESLSPKKQEAFFLWAMGMSYREIAASVDLPKSTICDLIIKVRTNAYYLVQ